MNTSPTTPSQRPGRLRRVIKWTALVLILLILAVAGGAWYLYRQVSHTPDWWTEMPQPTAASTQLADSLENRLARQISEPTELPYTDETTPAADSDAPHDDAGPNDPADPEDSPPADRVIVIEQAELDAWVASKAPDWLAHREIELPSQIRGYRVALRENQVILAMAAEHNGSVKILSFIFAPVHTDRGTVQARLQQVGFGRLTLPAGSLGTLIDRLADGSAARRAYLEKLREELDQLQQTDLELAIDDARMVRLIEADLADGKATLTVRTLPLSENSPPISD